MGSTGLNAVDHSPPGLDRPEKGRCCKVYTGKCTRGYESLLMKKAPEEQPDFQACLVSSASWLEGFFVVLPEADALAESRTLSSLGRMPTSSVRFSFRAFMPSRDFPYRALL